MRFFVVPFFALLILSMTTSSALMIYPQEPIPQAFAQSTNESIEFSGKFLGKHEDNEFKTIGRYTIDDQTFKKINGMGTFAIEESDDKCRPLTSTNVIDLGDENTISMDIQGDICSKRFLSIFKGTFVGTGGTGDFKGSTGSGEISTLIGKKHFGGKLDGTITLDPNVAIVQEYLELISKFDNTGQNIAETEVTQELIDSIKLDLTRLGEIVTQLQLNGFDGTATSETIDGKVVGLVSFFNKETSEPLFEIQIPDGALAIFSIFGLISEFEGASSAFTLEEQIALINDSLIISNAFANSGDEEIATQFVLSAIGTYHPSTGNTFFIPIAIILITIAFQECLASGLCEIILQSAAMFVIEEVIPFHFPTIGIPVFKYNDILGDGEFVEADGDVGVEGFEFTIDSITSLIIPPSPEISDSDGFLRFTVVIPRVDTTFAVFETPQEGWIPTTQELFSQTIDVRFTPDTITLEPPGLLFGNQEVPSTSITVIKNVINDDLGTAASSDFTISVTGTNVSPSSFPGDSSGTTVSLDPGIYSVKETGPDGYIGKLSEDCSGTILENDKKVCIIDNDDLPPAIFPVLAIDVSPKNGGNACSISNTLARDGATAGLDYRVLGFGTGGLGMLPGATPFVAGCIAADFGETQDPGPITVTAGRDSNACGRACTGSNCNRPTERFHVFSSTDLSAYTLVGSSPTAPPNQPLGPLRDYAFSVNGEFRFIAVCRSGAGPAASDIMLDSIVVGGFSSTPLPPSLLASTQSSSVGGPYFYPKINQTSFDVSKPDTVTIPLKIEWEPGYYSNPVTVEIFNMTSGITSSVTSVKNGPHYELFDVFLDVTAAAEIGEHVFEVLVTEISSSDTNTKEIRLGVN